MKKSFIGNQNKEEFEELSNEEIKELREKEAFQDAYLKELEKIEDEIEEGDNMIDNETMDEQQWNAHFAFLQKCSQEERQVSIVLNEQE